MCLGKLEKPETLCDSEANKSHLQDGTTMLCARGPLYEILLCRATFSNT